MVRPRIRSIKPEFWQDERVVALSRDARLLTVGLMTMADDEGRFRARRSTILGHVFPGDDDALELVDGWIGEIRDQGLVLFYVVDETPYGAFRHWKKHQRINRPTPSDLPPPPDPRVVRENRVPRKRSSSEESVNGHGEISESDVSAHSSHARPIRSDPLPVLSFPTAESKTRELCFRLAWHIRRNDPKADPSWRSDRWQSDMRLLVMDRGGDDPAFLEVEKIIGWSQQDSFWRTNILSPGKLRKQFTQLALKADSPTGQVVQMPSRKESPSDLWRAINGPSDFIEGSAS